MTSTADILASLGEQVRQVRIAEGLSQVELADRANLGIATVRRLEAGADTSVSTLIAVGRVLGRHDWFEAFDPVGAGPTPMQLLRAREGLPPRPRRVSRNRQS